MHKVIIERPRWNPGPIQHGRLQQTAQEDLPKQEGIRRSYARRKQFTDLFGPLKRWLRSQKGRHWDDVYSDACAVIDPRSVVQNHLKSHLLEWVQRHTFLKGDDVWCFTTHGLARELPIEFAITRWSRFYVHPGTGLLCELPVPPRKRRGNENVRVRWLTQRWIDETTLLRRLKAGWFACVMTKFPRYFEPGDRPWRFDAAEKRLICRADADALYGRRVFCVSKRQLSRREMNRHELSCSADCSRRCVGQNKRMDGCNHSKRDRDAARTTSLTTQHWRPYGKSHNASRQPVFSKSPASGERAFPLKHKSSADNESFMGTRS